MPAASEGPDGQPGRNVRPPRPEQRKLALGLPKAGQEVRGRACCTPALGGEEEREGGPWENISASEPGPLGFPEGSPASFTEAHWGKLWEISMKDRKPEARLFPENVGIDHLSRLLLPLSLFPGIQEGQFL